MIRSWGNRVRTAVVAGAAVVVLAACQPVVVNVSGGGATACPQGTFQLTSQDVKALLDTVLGKLTVQPTTGNLTLTNTASTWRLSGTQSLKITGPSPYGAVDGTVNATIDGSGTYTKGTGTLSFTLTGLSGSGTFTGTIGGRPMTISRTLADLGVDDLYGLQGTASFSCGTSPKLQLSFSSVTLRF